MLDKWRVFDLEQNSRVVIEPPEAVNEKYDDLWLEITGNVILIDKIKIGQIICDKLNRE